MIGTLQRYVTRELFKTFALTAVGLTLVFTLCGGVMNMIRAEVLSAVQLGHLFARVLPISATLTLPISALYACAIVYGRLAADNEFDACKASGINIQRLLLPALLLSIFTAAFTFSFSNYLIPKLIAQLEAMVRKDLQKIVYQMLSTRGYAKYMNYVLYAGKTELFDEDPNRQTIHIRQAAFLELEGERLTRCGTAERATVDFITDPETGMPIVQANLYNIRSLDVVRNQFMDFREQPFDPMAIPMQRALKPKWLTLPQLLYYRDHLVELPSIQRDLRALQRLVRRTLFFKLIYGQLTGPEKVFRIRDARVAYEIRAEQVGQEIDSLRPQLRHVTVTERRADGTHRIYKAESCRLDVDRVRGRQGRYALTIRLRGQVTMRDASAPHAKVPVHKRWSLDPVMLPEKLPGEERILSTEALLGPLTPGGSFTADLSSLGLGPRVDREREAERRTIIKSGLEISGIIHSRLAFSASSLVILVLAAALGIIFRGGQLLTAFVIAFVPGLLVVVMNIMGRQLTENSGTHLVGISLIWGGLAVLAAADGVVLWRFLRR